MDLVTMVYLADISGGVQFTAIVVALLLCLLSGTLLAAHYESRGALSIKAPIISGVFCLLFLMVGTLFPSKQGIYTMAAARGVEIAASSPDVKRLAGKSLDVLEKAMDGYLTQKEGK